MSRAPSPPVDLPATVSARSPRRATGRNVAIFLLAFIAFQCAVDRVASPFQGADKIEKKFAYFAAHKDEFDYVFIGSSRVLNQISPRVFDQAMAAAGRPCRSINLGYAAMFLPESSLMIDRVRALHPARLRGMLVELSSPTPRHDEQHPLMAREIYWHGPVGTALACAAVLTESSPGYSDSERHEQFWRQLSIQARCLFHLGNGPDFIERLWTIRRRRVVALRPTRDILGPDLNGFSPLTTTLGQGGPGGGFKNGGTPADRKNFEDAVVALRTEEASPPGPLPPSPGASLGRAILCGVLARQSAALRAAGIEPIYFIGPGTTREQPFLDLAAQGVVPRLLAFNDPAVYPELYAPGVRADRYHLNAHGAELLTGLVVQRLTKPASPLP